MPTPNPEHGSNHQPEQPAGSVKVDHPSQFEVGETGTVVERGVVVAEFAIERFMPSAGGGILLALVKLGFSDRWYTVTARVPMWRDMICFFDNGPDARLLFVPDADYYKDLPNATRSITGVKLGSITARAMMQGRKVKRQ